MNEVIVNGQHLLHRIIRKAAFTLRDIMVPQPQNTTLPDPSWIKCSLSSLFIWSKWIPKISGLSSKAYLS